jgi:hypothetical protein
MRTIALLVENHHPYEWLHVSSDKEERALDVLAHLHSTALQVWQHRSGWQPEGMCLTPSDSGPDGSHTAPHDWLTPTPVEQQADES